jgi:hypothetical protein
MLWIVLALIAMVAIASWVRREADKARRGE